MAIRAPLWRDRLRQAVRDSGVTQAEIARRARLPEETVSRVLTGVSRNPGIETVYRIAHAARVQVGWLLEERGYGLSARQVRKLLDAAEAISEAFE